MKKSAIVSLCAMVASAFIGTATIDAHAAEKHTLKIAHTTLPVPSNPRSAIDKFTDRVTKETDGRITFKVYGIELGDYLTTNEMLLRGEIDMILDPVATTFDPRWAAMQFPYIVTDYEKAESVFGPAGFMNGLFKEWAAEKGMYWLGTWMQGFTGVSTNSPATTVEEAKGIKIRSTPIGLVQHVYRNLGFEVSILPYSEVPTAISTGVVEGQAGGGPAQSWNLVRDLNKYYIHYRDSLELWGFIMNMDSWKNLDPKDQEIIQNAANDLIAERVKVAETEEADYMKQLADHGLTVIDLINDPAKLAKAVELGRKTWGSMEETIGKEAMDEIRKNIQ